MYGDIWWTYCVDHFTIYMMHILNHCFIPETNIMFYVNYISIGKKKKWRKRPKNEMANYLCFAYQCQSVCSDNLHFDENQTCLVLAGKVTMMDGL